MKNLSKGGIPHNPKLLPLELSVHFGGENIAGKESPLIAGITALLIGGALAAYPSVLQPAGIAIFIIGIAILMAYVISITKG